MTSSTDADETQIVAAPDVSSILFACNINAVRSAMAEAMVKARFPGRIFTDSCGVAPGEPDGFAMSVMTEIGLDMTSHMPKGSMTSTANSTTSSSPFRRRPMNAPSNSRATSTARRCTGPSTIWPDFRARGRSACGPIVRCVTTSPQSSPCIFPTARYRERMRQTLPRLDLFAIFGHL